MKTLQVTAWDSFGHNFNGYKIHRALLEMGHDSHMAVMQAQYKEEGIHQIESPVLWGINRFLSKAERFLSLHGVLPVLSLGMYPEHYYQKADLVHLQLLHGGQWFSLFNLPIISRSKPTLWTLHDPWITTGHCIHPLDCPRWLTGCGKCPDLTLPIVSRMDNTAVNWRIKNWVMHHSGLELVVSSPWMEERVAQSPILNHLPVHRIPFGLDPGLFYLRDKAECRAAFSIPPDARVLAFRESDPAYKLKGIEYIKEALDEMARGETVYLLTFEGQGLMEFPRDKYITIELGWVHDPELLAKALGAADMFLMPSLAESFGLMAVEAMACGTPPIVFEGSALPDVIMAPKGGLSVPARDGKALMNAIEQLWDQPDLYRGLVEEGQKIVRENYTLDLYVQRHLELYQYILEKSGKEKAE